MYANWQKLDPGDRTFLDKLDERVMRTHFSFAGKSVRETWRMWLDHMSARDLAAATQLLPKIEDELDVAFNELKESLSKVHPSAARWILPGEDDGTGKFHSYVMPRGGETFSRSRGAWLIGVFGAGENLDRNSALTAFNKYVRWSAAFLVRWHILSDFGNGMGSHTLGESIAAHRILGVETRMSWIADEICRQLGRWVDDEHRGAVDTLGSAVMERISLNASMSIGEVKGLFESMEEDSLGRANVVYSFSERLLQGVPSKTIESLTAKHQELTDRHLHAALEGELPDLRPVVRVAGENLVLNRSAWLVERDHPMMNVLMESLPSDRFGKPLEDISAALLGRWGPDEFVWRPSITITQWESGKGSRNGDDVDVLGLSDEIAIICECKANRLSQNNFSLDANFDSKILQKAASQVALRTTHWSEGWRDSETSDSSAVATGLIVTLSSYAGGVWSAPKLHHDGELVGICVFPLHALMLAICLIPDPARFASYLNWRTGLLKMGLVTFDELELSLTFTSQGPTAPTGGDHEGRVLFRGYELSSEAVSELDPRTYATDCDWRRTYFNQLWEASEPASPTLSRRY